MSQRIRVVLIHGAGGGGWEYDSWKPGLALSGWDVVAQDLHPAAAGLENTLFSDYLDQVVTWTEDSENTVLVGTSMGGVLALKAAERIQPRALVLVNPLPPMGLTSPLAETNFPAIVRWKGKPTMETALALLDADDDTITRASALWRDESGAVLNTLARGVAADRPRCPVLIVLGAEDREVPAATGQALARAYGADVQLYAGMSHAGPLLGTRSRVVAESVVGWIRGALTPDTH